MRFIAEWICPSELKKHVCPVFLRKWNNNGKEIRKATLYVTALGTYEARLNGERVSDYVLAPGWTAYEKRLQYQEYDITDLLKEENELTITVGKGWFRSPMPGFGDTRDCVLRTERPCGIFAEIHLEYKDGFQNIIPTDTKWMWGDSPVLFSEIYDGEVFDAAFITEKWEQCKILDWQTDILIPQEGEKILEMELVFPKEIIKTPAGEIVIDFGQEITGYVEISLTAKKGDRIHILHGEVLDSNGNFYNENYRGAKAEITYFCKDGKQTWHPKLTFYGFRYIKLDEFPIEPQLDCFQGIVVYSEIRQTGEIQCSDESLNRLFSNILWGQKGNFLDVPTDCPQRDERLGWTGDAQVFVKTASYNYDVERFFRKWLHDLAAEQRENGEVGQVIPDFRPDDPCSSAWGDAATICPWQIYMTYGNREILVEQFDSMKAWVDYITAATETEDLWTGGFHFGDWLGLDAPCGSYKGASREEFIASAFYAYSTSLVVRAGHELKTDVEIYENLYDRIVKKFRKTFTVYYTQTEYVLAIMFGLTDNPQKKTDELVSMIKKTGHMTTGFVGTPYLLHVLSDYGYTELAYSLLLRKEYPGWLYSVEKGATTIWEHWDGIMPSGEFWSSDMNSFNHYAYGSVADWIYEVAAGIKPTESGFRKIRIEPKADRRLKWLSASIETRQGKVSSKWTCTDKGIRYDIETPVETQVVLHEKTITVQRGKYVFWV